MPNPLTFWAAGCLHALHLRCQDWLGEPPVLRRAGAKHPAHAQGAQDELTMPELPSATEHPQDEDLHDDCNSPGPELPPKSTLQVLMFDYRIHVISRSMALHAA